MKKAIYILSVFAILLIILIGILWLPFIYNNTNPTQEVRYGIHDGLELVEQTYVSTGKKYVVEDENRNILFVIPLRNCIIDTHYRNGMLRFREQGSNREGYIDRHGIVAFVDNMKASVPENDKTGTTTTFVSDNNASSMQQPNSIANKQLNTKVIKTSNITSKSQHLSQLSLQAIAQSDPFYREATKILNGKLSEQDANNRHIILNYCEHLRSAYTTKDIDFLKQVFSDKALIIVGNVVQSATNNGKCQAEPKVNYAIHSKRNYMERLAKVFALNKKIDVKFSNFHILRHPTMDGIYGVTLRQQYHSDRYSDDGYLFLLWDFRNKSMPLIHVRTWQPALSVANGEEVISIQDFNLQ